VVFTAGDLESTGSDQGFDEFSAADSSLAYVVGQRRLKTIRRYIGFNYADPGYSGAKARFLPFNNLVAGKQYTFYGRDFRKARISPGEKALRSSGP
jgi:hypothetical protein